MVNAWVSFVKKWASDNNMSYGCALSKPECSQSYRATRPPKLSKKETAETERMGAEDVSATARRELARREAARQTAETSGMMGEDRKVAIPKKTKQFIQAMQSNTETYSNYIKSFKTDDILMLYRIKDNKIVDLEKIAIRKKTASTLLYSDSMQYNSKITIHPSGYSKVSSYIVYGNWHGTEYKYNKKKFDDGYRLFKKGGYNGKFDSLFKYSAKGDGRYYFVEDVYPIKSAIKLELEKLTKEYNDFYNKETISTTKDDKLKWKMSREYVDTFIRDYKKVYDIL